MARARAAGFGQGDHLLVGFSGGRDSLALAAALRRARDIMGLELMLIHVDHRLRDESAEDARRALKLADALGLPARAVEARELPMASDPGVGLEEAARRVRYQLLAAEAATFGAPAVATAHHQGDQAETVLLHLLRGGGVHGAAGMSERSPLPLPEAPTPLNNISHQPGEPWLWRPLLSVPRADINDYIDRLELCPLEDPSNDDVTLRRNALRHQVLPLLERHVPGAGEALARYAALASEDDRLLETMAEEALRLAVDPGGYLVAARLREQPPALQRRVVRRWLSSTTRLRSLSAERTEAVVRLAMPGQGGAAIEVGEGWTVRRVGGTLRAAGVANEHTGRDE